MRFPFIAACLGAAALTASAAFATEPTLNITSPTGSVVVSGFPYGVPITLTVYHPDELKATNVLDVQVNGKSILPGQTAIGNPFQLSGNDTGCSAAVNSGGLSCTLGDVYHATVTVPWTVSSPGSYVLSISLKSTGDTGTDSETVNVQVVSLEYPAPPAIANEYINTTDLKKAAPKIRGCVLNVIAHNHGQDHKYGPAPGPYNNPLVREDVRTLWPSCGGTLPAGLPQ